MRLIVLSLTAYTMVGGLAFAQGPMNQQPAGAAPAGGEPTLQQQPAGEIPQQDAGPARAPGSKAESGTVLPNANDNSGTTTYYEPSKPAAEVPWPCAQKKVTSISPGTLWSGPSLDEGKGWDDDSPLAQLAQRLASRRTALDEADGLIADFAKQAGADKGKKLTQLFVGTLDIINSTRSQLLNGIQRYAQGQERLAERMREESDKISEAQGEAIGATGVAVEARNKDFAWDQRIFQERKQALTYVCETPSILERRAYEISKRIQAQL